MSMIRLLPTASTHPTYATLAPATTNIDTVFRTALEDPQNGRVYLKTVSASALSLVTDEEAKIVTLNFVTAVTTLAAAEALFTGHPLIRVLTPGTAANVLTVANDVISATALQPAGTTATNSPPSGDTAGVKLPHETDRALLWLYSTAGSGTMTVTCKLWGWNNRLRVWCPLGTNSTAASKGLINGTNAIGEVAADTLLHCEEITSLQKIDRVYLEVTAIGGTATAVAAYLDCAPTQASTAG